MYTRVFDKYKELLSQFLSFETISALNHPKEIKQAVFWLENLFSKNNFEVETVYGYDNPVIIATKEVDSTLPTVLIYGHYDVQPASFEEWGSDPFVLRELNSRFMGRGVVDNKGQVLVHIVNVFDLLEKGRLAYNVKFLIEGNEETGSPNIGKLLEKYKKQLNCDFVLISDSAMIQNHPTIELGLRGTLNTTLTITTSDRDLHSGLFGGVVPNALHEASELLAKLFTDKNIISYPEFYDGVVNQEGSLEELITEIPFSEKEYRDLTGCNEMILEHNQNFFSQTGLRPTIQVTGIESGYTGKGYRNSIPSSAIIKFNFRLVPNQDPDKVLSNFKKYVNRTLPGYIKHKFTLPESTEGSVKAVRVSIENRYIEKAKQVLEEVYNKKIYYSFNGATLPIVANFERVLGSNIVMVALANADCNMHAIDENFDLQSLEKGLEFSNKFLSTQV